MISQEYASKAKIKLSSHLAPFIKHIILYIGYCTHISKIQKSTSNSQFCRLARVLAHFRVRNDVFRSRLQKEWSRLKNNKNKNKYLSHIFGVSNMLWHEIFLHRYIHLQYVYDKHRERLLLVKNAAMLRGQFFFLWKTCEIFLQ